MQSVIKLAYNLLCNLHLTPFYHFGSNIWSFFAFISICSIDMLIKIRKNGFHVFKKRYEQKVLNTEI